MGIALLEFGVSALVVVLAGVFLTRSADKIAEITGLGGLLVGGIFLAAATSLPELTVNISAVEQGNPDIAIGNLFGSSLFNLMILAICDLLHRSKQRAFSRSSAKHALAATQSIVMTALAGFGLSFALFSREPVFGSIGLSSILLMLAYILGLRMIFRDQRFVDETSSGSNVESERGVSRKKALMGPVFNYLVAVAVLFVAAPYVAQSAAKIAKFSGLGDTFIGTSLVAFCTSLPEFVASFAAIRMGAYDLALGNIFGSNSFNMVLIIPLDFVAANPILATVSSSHLLACLATIGISAVAIMGQLFQVEKRRLMLEPDASIVILLVLGAVAAIYSVGP